MQTRVGKDKIMFLMDKENDKMNCRHYINKIDDYIEGRLGKDENLLFENHLHTCPECLELVRLQKMTDRIIAEEKKQVPDFYLTGRIMARIENVENETSSTLIRILRPVVFSISVAASIFAGVLIGNISGRPAVTKMPVELTMMNDGDMEAINVLSAE